MAAAALNISEIYEKAWKLTKEHFSFLIIYQLMLYLVGALFLAGFFGAYKIFLIHLALLLLVIVGKIGFFRSSLMIADGVTPGYEQFYVNWKLFGSWFVAWVLFDVAFILGTDLLIVPGMFILARFGLFPFFIVDKGLGSIDAFRKAYEVSKGHGWELLWFFLAALLLNSAGLLVFGFGLLITFPVTCIAVAIAYRQLNEEIL